MGRITQIYNIVIIAAKKASSTHGAHVRYLHWYLLIHDESKWRLMQIYANTGYNTSLILQEISLIHSDNDEDSDGESL